MLATAGYDVARVVAWDFSDVPEMAPVGVHRHCPVVQDSTGCSMSEHSARLAHSRGGEIGCLIDAAVVVLGSVGERDDELDARAALEQKLDGYRNYRMSIFDAVALAVTSFKSKTVFKEWSVLRRAKCPTFWPFVCLGVSHFFSLH